MNEDYLNATIEGAYDATNYGGLEKIYTFLRKQNINDISRKNIRDFLASQEQEQLLKSQKSATGKGHLTAMYPYEIVQLDIYDLSRYETHNKGYKYILACVDIFTRKAFAEPMKTKTSEEVSINFKKILKQIGTNPKIIMSDNDSAFLSEPFENLLTAHNIILDPNALNDHHALGIIDNFAKRIKLTFAKIFIKKKTKDWKNHLYQVISKYNESDHTSIDNIKPNEADDESHFQQILSINIAKNEASNASKPKSKSSDLKINDNVRIRTSNIFTKASDVQFSNEVYKVVSINGNKIELNNNKIYTRANILKVSKTAQPIANNPIIEVRQEAKQRRAIKKAGVDITNIINQPRIRKANTKYN